jgi:hypothetical protein
MIVAKRNLIPSRIISNVFLNTFIDEGQFFIKQVESSDHPLTAHKKGKFRNVLKNKNGHQRNKPMSPGMVILRIRIKHFLCEIKFPRRILRHFDDCSAMIPQLIVLGVF